MSLRIKKISFFFFCSLIERNTNWAANLKLGHIPKFLLQAIIHLCGFTVLTGPMRASISVMWTVMKRRFLVVVFVFFLKSLFYRNQQWRRSYQISWGSASGRTFQGHFFFWSFFFFSFLSASRCTKLFVQPDPSRTGVKWIHTWITTGIRKKNGWK